MRHDTQSKVIFAIDPYEDELQVTRNTRREFRYWAKKMASSLEAVYVLPESMDEPRFNQLYSKAYDRLSEKLAHLDLGIPIEKKVIWNRDETLQDPALTLTDYAQSKGADLILVLSHGRKWISRMVLGSFAEKVLMHATTPVLFFGLLPAPHESLHKVLFATDFSEASRLAFELFLKQIKPMNPEVLVLHVAEYPNLVTGMSLTGVGAYLPDTYWKVMKESLLNEGEHWVALAQSEGVRARAVIEDGLGDVASAIIKTARDEHVSLIGLSSIRSELQKVVMGSISTRVFRAHGHSVWVCGPRVFENPPIKPQREIHPSREMR
jgi:nucleotide-binding universal stress UspA family protein